MEQWRLFRARRVQCSQRSACGERNMKKGARAKCFAVAVHPLNDITEGQHVRSVLGDMQLALGTVKTANPDKVRVRQSSNDLQSVDGLIKIGTLDIELPNTGTFPRR